MFPNLQVLLFLKVKLNFHLLLLGLLGGRCGGGGGGGKVRPVLGNTAPSYLTGGLSELELGHELGLSSAVLNPWT